MTKWQARLLFLVAMVVLVAFAYQFPAPLQIDLGTPSANPFVEGFYFREREGVTSFRWSGPQAILYFVGIGNQEGVLRIHVRALREQVILRVNGQTVSLDAFPGGQGGEKAFAISRRMVGPAGDLVVTLETETFTAPPDTRELGLQVVSVSFEQGIGPVIPAPRVMGYLLLAVVVAYGIAQAWSGSARLALGISAVVAIVAAWGLAQARLETVFLLRVGVWFGVAVYLGGLAVIWLLRRFCTFEERTLRVLGLFVLAAFALRLPLAMTPGFIVDVQDYVVWSYKVTRYGIGSAYHVVEGLWIADYPPGLLYLFRGLGALYQKLFAPDFLYPVIAGDPALRAVTTNAALLADPIHRTLLRMPAIVADLITGALIFALARRTVSKRTSFLIAASYWFNPAIIYNSALYGQTDAVHTLLVVLAFALAEMARSGWGFLMLGVGALTKPQTLVFGPLLLLRAFQKQRWRGVMLAAAGGLLGLGLVAMPMVAVGDLEGLLSHLGGMVGHHPILSANAHNLWWFVMHGNIDIKDTTTIFAGANYQMVGLLLLAGAYGLALVGTLRNPDRPVWPVAAYIGFAFFTLPTEIHENYAFAVMALLVIALVSDRRYALLYAFLTVTMVANYGLHDPNVYRLLELSSPDAQLSAARWLNAMLNTLLFFAWTVLELANLRKSDRR